jgi:hypothetical protein
MVKKWRPEKWEGENIKAKQNPSLFVTCDSSFEAGADAMLEALRKGALTLDQRKNLVQISPDTWRFRLSPDSYSEIKGVLVFIPGDPTGNPSARLGGNPSTALGVKED